MRRLSVGVLVMLALVACGGGADTSGGHAAIVGAPETTAPAATGPCGLKPITFANERWQGSATVPPQADGALWEQTYTFTNPNSVDIRLTPGVVHLRLSGSGGYFFKFARTTFRPAADDTVPAGRDQQRVAEVWLANGNTPATEDLYATTSVKVGGADCVAAVDRISTGAVPAHVLALPSCDPRDAPAPC